MDMVHLQHSFIRLQAYGLWNAITLLAVLDWSMGTHCLGSGSLFTDGGVAVE